MSQSVITTFTNGQTLTAAELNTAFAEAAAASSVQPNIAANAGKLLAGPVAAGGQPVALTLGTGLAISGSTLNAASAGAIRLITTGITDTITATDGFIAWKSATIGVKAETVGPGQADQIVTIKDAIGTAGTTGNAIVITGTGCTIDNTGFLTLATNYQAVTITWDGISNWMVN